MRKHSLDCAQPSPTLTLSVGTRLGHSTAATYASPHWVWVPGGLLPDLSHSEHSSFPDRSCSEPVHSAWGIAGWLAGWLAGVEGGISYSLWGQKELKTSISLAPTAQTQEGAKQPFLSPL